MEDPTDTTRQTQKRGILWNRLVFTYVKLLSRQQVKALKSSPFKPTDKMPLSSSSKTFLLTTGQRLKRVSQYFERRHVANVQLQCDC
jgi:hypothetical protein